MKINYALLLSFEGITLARRTMAGWLRVGEVALDAADLATALAALRRKAETLSSDADRVKLVIPNEQIRYLQLPAKHRSADDLNEDIRAALDGKTPYSVDELVFDWAELSDGSVQVAATARETLDEAQQFATSYNFIPISFVAAAPAGAFHGEVFFGPASGGANGSTPSRDTQPVVIVEPEKAPPPATRPEAREELPSADGDTKPAAEDGVITDQAVTSDLPPSGSGTDIQPTPDHETHAASPGRSPLDLDRVSDTHGQNRQKTFSGEAGDAIDGPTPHWRRADPSDRTRKSSQVADLPSQRVSGIEPPEHPSTNKHQTGTNGTRKVSSTDDNRGVSGAGAARNLRVTTSASVPSKNVTAVRIRASRPAPDAPVPKLSGTLSDFGNPDHTEDSEDGVADEATAAPIASLKRKSANAPDLPAQDTNQKRPGFGLFGRRNARKEPQLPVPPADKPAVTTETVEQHKKDASQLAPVQRLAAAEPTPRRARAAQTAAQIASPSPEEADRMTVFGARKSNDRIGGKPRFLGLMLTAALILFLAVVAAWAAVFVDDGIARFFRPSPAPASEPQFSQPPASDVIDPSETEPEPDIEVASLAPDLSGEADEAASVDDDETAFEGEAVTAPLSLEAEEAAYAATGIWLRPPSEPSLPRQVSLDDLYVASIDTSVQQFDAVALPPAKGYATDAAMLSPASPAAPGTEFTLDDRGLVVATLQGAMNPDGILVYSGRPPVVPPESRAMPEAEAQPSAEEDAQLRALSLKRPRARPVDLVEKAERATLAGRSLAELSVLRPKLRPATLQWVENPAVDTDQVSEDELAESDDGPPATEQAVKTSVTPVSPPRNFAALVEKAREAPAPASSNATVASVAPRTVSPNIPSSTNVAREATVRNQLNLGRVNLIGVYGTPSRRQALIRLSSGRYQRVKVGDRLDGGRVAAIGDSELRYVKGGRNVVLKMPRG